ncbi:MAG TPA: hypothetical protein VNP96_06005 [Solirubrobacterales bacterium]|nr:hypothetical protein [Solirubrobacterales bacterium]
MAVEALSYAIDDQDRLIRLDEGFYRFAEENGWTDVGSSLGRSLWDFVAGEEVRKLQRMLLRRIRDSVGTVQLPFRCDGPEASREMDIRIAADSSGRVVLFSARMRSEEAWEEPQPLLDPRAPRDEDFLPMCAWCDRFLVAGEWVEVEVAAKRLELFRRSEMPTIDHSICPRCSSILLTA